MLDRVRRKQEPVIVRTYETPQAVLIPYDQFEAYQAWQERRQKRGAELAELRTIAEEVSARAALSDEAASFCGKGKSACPRQVDFHNQGWMTGVEHRLSKTRQGRLAAVSPSFLS